VEADTFQNVLGVQDWIPAGVALKFAKPFIFMSHIAELLLKPEFH